MQSYIEVLTDVYFVRIEV